MRKIVRAAIVAAINEANQRDIDRDEHWADIVVNNKVIGEVWNGRVLFGAGWRRARGFRISLISERSWLRDTCNRAAGWGWDNRRAHIAEARKERLRSPIKLGA